MKISRQRFPFILFAAALALLLGGGGRPAPDTPKPGTLTGRVCFCAGAQMEGGRYFAQGV